MQTFKPQVIDKDPNELKPYQYNAKVHSRKQIEDIATQIAEFGFTQPILVDKDMVVVAGHGRREASLLLGLKHVPVIIADHLTPDQVKAARIADNKVAEAPWDPEMLKIDLSALQLSGFDLGLTAIDLKQITSLMNPATSENTFSENDHKDVSQRKDQYDNSDLRQMILVMDPETFEKLMTTFAALQTEFGVETNLEVVEKLVEHYAANRSK